MSFNDRLKTLREAAGLTQEALARAAGLSTSGVAKLERLPMGPSWDTAVKLANALGVPLDAFKDVDDAPAEVPPVEEPDAKPDHPRKPAGPPVEGPKPAKKPRKRTKGE